MNTNLTCLSGRTEFPHTYVLASQKQGQQEDALNSSPSHSKQLERARLAAQEVTNPYFKGEKTLIGQTVRELKKGEVISWNKVMNNDLISMSAKAMQIVLKRILREIEAERLEEYLTECRKKLKESFRRLYLRIREEHEELNRLQLKEVILKPRNT